MDRQLLERMVGAAVLIVALVVLAPAILDGPERLEPVTPSGLPDTEVRTVTIRPDGQAEEPPVARPTVAQASPESTPEPVAETTAPEPVTDAAPVKPAPAAPVAKPKPEPKPEPKPAAKPAPKPPARAAPAREGWAVQLGSFANRDNARRLAGEVSAKGYETYLLPLKKGGQTLYRVRVGPKPSRAAAEKLAGELAKAGYKGQVAPEGQAT